MRKVITSLITPFIFGVLSGIAVYFTFRILPMIPGIIFALFSGVYFNLRMKIPIHDLIVWISFSFASFLLAFFVDLVMLFSDPSIDQAARLGSGGFIGVLVLIVGFHSLFSHLKFKELCFIIGIATLIPAYFSSYVDYAGDNSDVTFWLPLFTLWQTFVLVSFSYVLNKRLTSLALQDEDQVVSATSSQFQSDIKPEGSIESLHSKANIVPDSGIPNTTLLKIAYGLCFVFLNFAFLGGTALYYGPYAGRFMEIMTWIVSNSLFVSALAIIDVPRAPHRELRLGLPVAFCILAYLLYVV
jgi:hypothetical protein